MTSPCFYTRPISTLAYSGFEIEIKNVEDPEAGLCVVSSVETFAANDLPRTVLLLPRYQPSVVGLLFSARPWYDV